MSMINKLLSQEFVQNVSFALCCAQNCYQCFLGQKTTLLREEFWGLSFEKCKAYGMDIPRRLHVRTNTKQQKLMMIQEIDIYEMTWYKIIGLSRSTYMLYKVDSKQGCKFLPHGNKGLHKFKTPTKQEKSNVQLLIDLSVDIMPHQLKGIKSGRQDVQ
jgi:hypothetical protein